MTKSPEEILAFLKSRQDMDQAYKNYLEALATAKPDPETNLGVVFYNSNARHASAVMSTIFRHSNHMVKIFAGNLSGKVSSDADYKRELDSFLKRGSLQILLDKEQIEDGMLKNVSDLLKYHSVLSSDKVSIRLHDQKVTFGDDEDSDNEVHFCIGDDRMYRIETDTKKFMAEGNFYDKETAQILDNIFNNIYNDSEVFDILKD